MGVLADGGGVVYGDPARGGSQTHPRLRFLLRTKKDVMITGDVTPFVCGKSSARSVP